MKEKAERYLSAWQELDSELYKVGPHLLKIEDVQKIAMLTGAKLILIDWMNPEEVQKEIERQQNK